MRKNFFKKIISSREFYLLTIILVIIAVIGIRSDNFFKPQNIQGLILSISVYSIIVSVLTVVFISGGFDISIGSVFSTAGVVLGICFNKGVPVYLAIIITILMGVIVGASIGLFVTKVGLSPFVTTLAYFYIFFGMSWYLGFIGFERSAYVTPVFGDFPESFLRIATGKFLGIEYIAYYMVAIVIILQILMVKNVFFRQSYYIGANELSARVIGIKVNIVKIFNYTLVSTFVAIAAVLRASNVGATIPGLAGLSFPLTMIAAVILGGGSLEGGTGSITGSILGVILITLLNNAMVMLGVNPYYNNLFLGLILLISILIDRYIKGFRFTRIKRVKV